MDKKIAVLGPKGTFTDMAAIQYTKAIGLELERCYYPSMRKTFGAVGQDCAVGILPIENTLDGFVQIILDLLNQTELKVIHEIVLPIRFAFVANTKSLKNVKQVYAQFKSENQCLDFLETLNDCAIITTSSNSQSYEKILLGEENSGAIIPMHMLSPEVDFELVVEDVADSLDNHTRFIVISKALNKEVDPSQHWKTSFVVSGDSDRPGLLSDILSLLSSGGVNMKSIMSRPTKSGLGNYNFFIDIDGCYQKDEHVRKAIEDVLDAYSIRILGSYYRIENK